MQKETEKNAIETVESKIPAQLRGVFCEPPLLEGEDPNPYWGLVAAVIDERKPETASDWIDVNDLVTKLWDERLLRRASNALVRGGMIEQLQYFLVEAAEPPAQGGRKGFYLEPLTSQPQQEKAEAAQRRARRYGVDPEETKEIRSLLARFGMTEAELHARAFERKSDALQMIERMLASRERGRRRLRKEDRRRLREERRADTERAGVKRKRSA